MMVADNINNNRWRKYNFVNGAVDKKQAASNGNSNESWN
jgi:hypothetical protein